MDLMQSTSKIRRKHFSKRSLRIRRQRKIAYTIVILCALIFPIAWYGFGGNSKYIADTMTDTSLNVADGVGVWGDSFGAFNALISSLAFVALIATLVFQVIISQDQEFDQHRQTFDSSFLGLLSLQRELRSKIVFDLTPEVKKAQKTGRHNLYSGAVNAGDLSGTGTDPVANACVEVQYRIIQRNPLKIAGIDDVKFAYMKFVHRKSETVIAPYFRLIYSMLDRVRNDKILSEEEKVRYGNLVRAQLSSSDVILLGINSLSPVSADMKDIVTEFRLLKYLPPSSMKRLLQRFHSPQAFAGRDDASPEAPSINFFNGDNRYRSVIAAFQAERLYKRIDRLTLSKSLGKNADYVTSYENGSYKLSLIEAVDVSKALKKHIAIFLRY